MGYLEIIITPCVQFIIVCVRMKTSRIMLGPHVHSHGYGKHCPMLEPDTPTMRVSLWNITDWWPWYSKPELNQPRWDLNEITFTQLWFWEADSDILPADCAIKTECCTVLSIKILHQTVCKAWHITLVCLMVIVSVSLQILPAGVIPTERQDMGKQRLKYV